MAYPAQFRQRSSLLQTSFPWSEDSPLVFSQGTIRVCAQTANRNISFGNLWICDIFFCPPGLMMMSPLYPWGKPCSTGTHNETVKNLTLFSAIINGLW